jgi:tetratricopeptide (TPR) repeat protein
VYKRQVQGLALVASRQGRTADAAKLLGQVDALVPRHPSTFYALGEANMSVWRFGEAASAYAKAAALQPDDRILRGWAMALGSTDRFSEALAVAQDGLAIEGRDPFLLRSQLLAYRALQAPEAWRDQAATALRIYERDSEAPHVRDMCSRADPVCKTDRTPLAVRWLNAPGALARPSGHQLRR